MRRIYLACLLHLASSESSSRLNTMAESCSRRNYLTNRSLGLEIIASLSHASSPADPFITQSMSPMAVCDNKSNGTCSAAAKEKHGHTEGPLASSRHERILLPELAGVGMGNVSGFSWCPNLLSLTLSGCGHITDHNVINVLQSCRRLRSLSLENCSRMTDSVLQAVVDHGDSLTDVRVDFCRNVTQAGLQKVTDKRPEVHLSALHSADMIPDSKPEEKTEIRRALQKFLIFS
ncbi:F-box and leucine-rich protein 22 [Labeo rohita]|uniref:F-box and leucine-rich protein 22 n=1 Tax=Labeo rohita TaxID=84645 RepID=A0ABQ8LC24_LABRO|nr:F-box and leucine-rich protein 22 [Labeo rohita]